MDEPSVRSIEEAEVVIRSLYARQAVIEELARDHAQRFDTLQTPFWKRWWFWLNGWPWYDLNAERPKRRPWHRWVRP
jgi:hypothetical protein